MDLFKLLKQDHEKVSGLFKKVAETSDGAIKTRERLRAQIKDELELHAEAEEAYFYPVLKQHADTKDKVPEAVQEHDEVRQKLAEIDALDPQDTGFLKQMKELQKLVQHHVREEEHEIFPAAKKALSEDETREALRKIEAMKKDHRRAAA